MESVVQPVKDAKRTEQTQIGMIHALDSDTIRFLLDPSGELAILENELLGREHIDGSWVDSKFTVKRINRMGAKALMSDMRIRLSKITSQSKLKDKLITVLVKRYAFNTSLWLFKYEKEWEIKSIADRTMILRLLVDAYLMTLHKAEGGWAGNKLAGMYNKTDTFQERPKSQGKRKWWVPG